MVFAGADGAFYLSVQPSQGNAGVRGRGGDAGNDAFIHAEKGFI